MSTPRQKLIKETISRLLLHNLKAMLGESGYHKITPKSRAFNELIEGVAQELGGKVWSYYLNTSDSAYYRLEAEIYRSS